MSVIEWNKDFQLGNPEIDSQKELFVNFVNDFDENYSESASKEEMLDFLEDLQLFAKNHFVLEEEFQEKHDYLLIQYHKQSHDSIMIFLSEFISNLKEDNIESPSLELKNFYYFWLQNHISKEDRRFKDFYFGKDILQNRKLLGSRCEILSLNNHILGEGKLKSHAEHRLIITNKNKELIPTDQKEIIKVLVFNKQKKITILTGRVFAFDVKTIILYNIRVQYMDESRDSTRTTTFLEAKVYHEVMPHSINILNMSASGLLFEDREFLKLGRNVMVKMYLDDEKISVPCHVVRIYKQKDYAIKYGCKFLFTSHWQEELVAKYLIERMAVKRKTIK